MKLPVRAYFALLVTYLKPQWRRSLLMALLLLMTVGLQLLGPQLVKYFIDTTLAHGAITSLLIAALLFIAVALSKQGITVADTYLSEYVAWTATNALRSDLVVHCLSLDLSFHKTRTTGELIERIDGDVDTLSNFFSQFIIRLLGSSILLVGVLIMFFRVDWRIGLGMSIFVILYIRTLMLLRRPIIPLWVKLRQVSADFFGFLSERLVGTEDIRANGATAYVMQRFLLLLRAWFPLYRKAQMANTVMVIVSFSMITGSMMCVLISGAYLHSLNPGVVTVGTLFTLYSYTVMLLQPVWSVQTQLQDLQQVEACIQRVQELFLTASALHDSGATPLPAGPLSVVFDAVTFGYVADIPVLHDLSFQLPQGRILGILGRTGSGKTTLARLLFRLYDPQSGEIRMDGIPIDMTPLRALRQHIGMVTQDVQLFQATVRDNLTFFDRSISDARVQDVLEDVGLAGWYHALPNGLESEIGPDGAGLSAGEAQLLAFARVFLTDPGLVILDEASSRLDPVTEVLIEKAMDRLFSNRTVIIIAHKLATIRRADEILILEGGRLLEYGARAMLASDGDSHFSQLLETGLEEVSYR